MTLARITARRERNNGSRARPAWSAVRSSQPLSRRLRLGGMAALEQVHDQEGQVVEHVDAGEIVVELDAVERHRPAVEQDDVAQMQVAVAVADEAGGAALLHRADRAGQPGLGGGRQGLHRLGREHAGRRRGSGPGCCHARPRAWRRSRPCRRRGGAAACSVATTSASRSTSSGASGPAPAIRSSSAAAGKRVISSSHSTGCPAPSRANRRRARAVTGRTRR